jgi:hypothetical protein
MHTAHSEFILCIAPEHCYVFVYNKQPFVRCHRPVPCKRCRDEKRELPPMGLVLRNTQEERRADGRAGVSHLPLA